jgi:preprotein translocase subunit SecE
MATDKKELRPALKKDALKKDKGRAQRRPRRFNPKRAAVSIGHFFKDVVSEMKKVTWASRKEFISYTIAVLVFVAACGVIIFAMDSVLRFIPTYIAQLNE